MAQLCEFTKCPSEMVEMVNFMSVYFTTVKYLVRELRSHMPHMQGLSLQRIILFNLTLPLFLMFIFLFTSSFLAMVPGLRWVKLV